MVTFPRTTRPSDNVLRIQGKRYLLATTEQARSAGARRSWDVVSRSAQDRPLGDPFALHFDFHHGYGLTFSPGASGYESANGWDATTEGKIATWPQHATLESVADTAYRGWWYYDYASGYLYLFRGRYSVKYAPDDSGSQWSILEFKTLGTSGQVVAGSPAVFNGRVYVPMLTASTGVLLRFYELATIATPVTEVQTVEMTGTPTGGTYTLSYNDGVNTYTTAAIAYNADGPTVQAALRLLPGLQKITVSTAGSVPNYTHTVTLTAAPTVIATASPPQLTSDASGLTGGAPVINHATTVAGTGDTWNRGDAAVEARCFVVWNKPTVGPVLVRANANNVSMASTTPTTAGNWSTVQSVFDSTFDVVSLATFGRLLYCGKPNMLASFDEQGQAVNEIPSISSVVDANNFVGMREHNGYLYAPHKLGLIRWRPGGAWSIVGAEQDDTLEGDRTTGWGRTIGIAPYGKYAYLTVADYFNSIGTVVSLEEHKSGQASSRGSLTPHMHHQLTNVEDVAVASLKAQAAQPLSLVTWSDDNAVGATAWGSPTNATSDDSAYAEAVGAGQTHYLKGLNLNPVLPSSATILGITARVKRSKATQDVTTAATSSGTQASDSSVGTNAWSNPTNAASSNNSYATCATDGTTQALKLTNFGFSIPSGASILGVTVEIERKSSAGSPGTISYSSAGSYQYVVPAGVTSITFTLNAGGGATGGGAYPGPGGAGGKIVGTLSVTPGETLDLVVGGVGAKTTLYRSTTPLLIAGGGGGGGTGSGATATGGSGGAGGGTTGGAGGTGGGSHLPGGGGGGGTQAANGATGNTPGGSNNAGGGGGTGYYNGGTGGYGGYWEDGPIEEGNFGIDGGGGGGGGSNYADAGATGVTHTQGGGAAANTAGSLSFVVPQVNDSRVSLVKADGTFSATNKSTGALWSNSEAYVSFGGAADVWGESLTPTIVNDADFGFILQAAILGSATASVDHGRVSITYQNADVVDTVVRLVKAGVVTGTNKADTSTQWPSSEGTATYGSSTDLWGTTWTAAEIAASNFGFVISATVTGGGKARVQHVSLEIAYSVPGASNPPSYLVVVQVSSDGATANPVAYKLPSAGMTVANDPQVPKYVTDGATFNGSRIVGPTRATVKRWSSVECYAELTAETAGSATPGFRIEANVDDGDEWYPLIDADGRSTFFESGSLELYFPAEISTGRWVQLRAVVDAVSGIEVGVEVQLRDVTLRGFLLSEPTDKVQAILVLKSGGQGDDGRADTRTAAQQREELESLLRPPADGARKVIEVHDPVLDRDIPVIVQGIAFAEVDFAGESESTLVATIELERVRARTRPR